MIWNIIDRRKRPYRWKCINAIVEATSHDNGPFKDGDQAESSPDGVTYLQREGISLADAIGWANSLPGGNTLFLYDEGGGTALRRQPLPDERRGTARDQAAASAYSNSDFVQFVERLRADLTNNPDAWENPTLDRFLGAMAAWVAASDSVGRPVPDNVSWRFFAKVMMAARNYE